MRRDERRTHRRPLTHRAGFATLGWLLLSLLLPTSSAAATLDADQVASYRQLTVVGLGDSVPSGSVCNCRPYVGLFADAAGQATGRTARPENLAQGGVTSGDLRGQLSTQRTRAALARADVVIVTVGANDFDESTLSRRQCQAGDRLGCDRRALTSLADNLTAVLARIDTLTLARRPAVLVTGYWNVFRDGQVARAQGSDYVLGSRALTSAVNATIAQVAVQYGATYVDLTGPFTGDGKRDDTGLLAADGDHPNASGHRLIADVLVKAWTPPSMVPASTPAPTTAASAARSRAESSRRH